MSIDKTLRFTQSRGFFIIKSLYQNDESRINKGYYIFLMDIFVRKPQRSVHKK